MEQNANEEIMVKSTFTLKILLGAVISPRDAASVDF